MTKDTGGPAFPAYMKDSAAFGQDFCQEGMTLRDWFAGQALRALLNDNTNPAAKVAAMYAYEYADAMIAERSKP